MTTQACMGGWCSKREHCANYNRGSGDPVERLCEPGQDGVCEDYRIVIHRPAGTWEPKREEQAA